MDRTRKRFIAGAECPACHATDTLQLQITERSDGTLDETVHCVACQHSFSEQDKQPKAAATASDTVKQDKNIIGIFKPE
ncbi:YheV family putative zinc ribbon protein [Pseudidiomarina sp. YC-516-91]|uniref:YheV family putative zinc ribbon protein n=1 Tax=Pseudidiomarina salilacus TaxID=3384452 RepID=UPI003984BB45